MKNEIFLSIMFLGSVSKMDFQKNYVQVNQSCDDLQSIIENKSEMKILHLVILVKYAQNAIVFNSFYSMLKSFKPHERKVFLLQIVELIGHFTIDSPVDLVIKESGLNSNCSACLILKEGINEMQLKRIVELPENELEPSFKLLLTLFSVGYQDGYKKHRNRPDEFWYWDYSEIENVDKLLRLDEKQRVQIDKILRP